MRAIDVIQRMVYESDEDVFDFALMCGYKHPENIYKLLRGEDCKVSTLYKVCKAGGYQVIVFNPSKKTSYLINGEHDPLKVKGAGQIRANRYKGYYVKDEYIKDVYTGEKIKKPYRPTKRYNKKKYRRQVEFIQVKKEIPKEEGNNEG